MEANDKAAQALSDITLNLEVCQVRLEKLQASPRTHQSHRDHAEGMIAGLEVASKLLRARLEL